jgi:hypothetical protein
MALTADAFFLQRKSLLELFSTCAFLLSANAQHSKKAGWHDADPSQYPVLQPLSLEIQRKSFRAFKYERLHKTPCCERTKKQYKPI